VVVAVRSIEIVGGGGGNSSVVCAGRIVGPEPSVVALVGSEPESAVCDTEVVADTLPAAGGPLTLVPPEDPHPLTGTAAASAPAAMISIRRISLSFAPTAEPAAWDAWIRSRQMISLRGQGFRAAVTPSNLPLAHRFGDDASRIRCGARLGRMNATYPLALVTIDAVAVRVEGVPTFDTWVERSAVEGVVDVRFLWGRGVRFRARDGRYDGVIIWCGHRVREALAQHGWPI
jgi:hypothetical protein